MALLERVRTADQTQRTCAVLAYGDLKRVQEVYLGGGTTFRQ